MQNLPSRDALQVLGPTGALKNMENYEWTAYIRRFGKNEDPEAAKTILKNLRKKKFEAQTTEIFNNMNTVLRNSLFGTDMVGEQRLIFNSMIDDSSFILYSFIKAE